MPLDDAADAQALLTAEGLDIRQLTALLRRPGDRGTDGMLRGVLQRPGEPQQFTCVGTSGRHHIHQRHDPRGDGAGLVQHDGIDPARRLEDLRTLDQDSQLGSPSGAHHQRGRSGQAQRAGAGNDEDRHSSGESRIRAIAEAEPETKRGSGQQDHDGDEDRRDPVRKSLYGSLARLRVLHEPRHLRELGVRTHSCGCDDQSPSGIDSGADDAVAHGDLNGNRFTGEHAGVHS